jgi:hypothetical protein
MIKDPGVPNLDLAAQQSRAKFVKPMFDTPSLLQ